MNAERPETELPTELWNIINKYRPKLPKRPLTNLNIVDAVQLEKYRAKTKNLKEMNPNGVICFFFETKNKGYKTSILSCGCYPDEFDSIIAELLRSIGKANKYE